MILARCSPVIVSSTSSLLPAKFSKNSNFSIFPSKFGSKESLSLKCSCTENEENANIFEAVSMLVIQTLEILVLLRYTAKPQYKNIGSFFQSNNFSKQRNWVVASTLGFGFLITVVVVTAFLADGLVGPKVMNNPVLAYCRTYFQVALSLNQHVSLPIVLRLLCLKRLFTKDFSWDLSLPR